MKLYERIENNNFDEIDRNRAIELIDGGNGHLVYNENYFKLQKENEELKSENRRLKVIRRSTEYGTENIHLITKRDLVEINTNKYFIEIQDRKFVDLKQVYQENEEIRIKNNAIKRENEAYAKNMIRLDNELNLEKEKSKYEWIRQNCLPQELVNKLYIPIQKIKDKIEELQKEYNKLDKQVDEYIKSVKKDVSTYYENKERTLIKQALSYFIDTLQELIEERKEK